MTCYVADLLQREIVLSIVSLFVGFYAIQLSDINPRESLDQIIFVTILHIWNLK